MLMLFVGCNKSNEVTTSPIEEGEDNSDQDTNDKCNEEQSNNEQKNDNNVTKFSLNYLSNLMVVTNNVTAYGIKQSSEEIDNVDIKSNFNTKISFLSSTLLDTTTQNDKQRKPKYSLFQTTEHYQNGNVEYNDNGISKVTFKKNISTTEELFDIKGNLITTDTTIYQEDLDAQINKVYTTHRYTFLQFIALVDNSGAYPYYNSNDEIEYEDITVRPSSMTYDENGVAEFDKTDYFSSNLTASFVIDNETGFIYKIENFYIKSFHNGLVVDEKGYYYTIKTNENHSLTFTDILPNKDVIINNAVYDNYGWTYVSNNLINAIDNENKIKYSTNIKYLIDSYNNVYVYSEYYAVPKILPKKMVNGVATEFENDTLIKLCMDYSYHILGYYKDCLIYDFALYCPEGISAIMSNNGSLFVPETATNYFWLDDNYDAIIQIKDKILYYKEIDYDDRVGFGDGFTKISDLELTKKNDYYLEVGNDKYKVNNVFYSVGRNGTIYYQIIKSEIGIELKELRSKSYEDNIIIFQPINKK